jgi:nonribosomal peptide synthetase protein BlmIX
MSAISSASEDPAGGLLGRLAERGAVVWADGDGLCLSAPEGALDAGMRDALRGAKAELLGWLFGPGALAPHRAHLRPSPEQLLLLRAGDGADYVACGLFRLDPPAGNTAFAAVLETVLARHDAFRAAFPRDGAGEFLMTLRGRAPRHSIIDVEGLGEEALNGLAADLAAEESRRPFDLAGGPLVRIRLLVRGQQVVGMVVAAHHVIMDRWSMDLLGEELALGLMAVEAGAAWAPEPAPSYAAAVARRTRLCGSERDSAATRAAAARLAAAPEPVALHGARRLHLRGHAAARLDRVFGGPLREALRRHGRPPVVMLAALSLLLARRTADGRLCLGLPVARRPDERAQATVGMFASSVPLVLQLTPLADAAACLAAASHALDEAIALQEADMSRAMEGRISYGLSPFNVLVSFQQGSRTMGTRFKPMPSSRSSAKAELVVFFDDCGLTLEYPEDIADGTAMVAMADELPRLAARLLAAVPGEAVDPPPQLESPAPRSWPAGRGPQWDLLAAARSRPDAVGLVDWSVEPPAALTFAKLATRVARVAAALRARGVGVDDLVGIDIAGAGDRAVAVLGTRWAGAAYVPIDARWPAERRRHACAGLRLILNDEAGVTGAGGPPGLRVAEALAWGGPTHQPVAAPGTSLSHVLHTSGSTGAPKRVALTRHGTDVFVAWAAETFGPALRRTLAMTPLSFDLSVFELFAPIAAGGSVLLLESPLEARRRMAACEPQLVNTTPSVMRELLRGVERLPPGCVVNLAGEAFGDELTDAVFRAGAARLTNLYGPTETTTYSSVAVVAPGTRGAAPIGGPIAATRLRLVDPSGQDGGSRWRGEVHIAGAGVARGYLADGALTAAAFVPGAGGQRWYATGDHAQHAVQGGLSFLGRADRQVKRRGVRIELDEVEAALLRDPGVAAAAAVYQANTDGGLLVAVVVPRPGAMLDALALSSRLPAYMAPDRIHLVAALPETASGKLDRVALDLERFVTLPGRPPRDAHEATVATIWASVVGREIVDREARFFDVGGDSLKLMRVADGLQRHYGAAVSPIELMRHATVAGMASFIGQRAAHVSGAN